jgi:oligoendopeptidase F
MAQSLPRRADVPLEQTWDIASVFPSDAAWEAAAAQARADTVLLAPYAGRLGESAATLLAALATRDRVQIAHDRVREYATMQTKADLGDQRAAGRLQIANAGRAAFVQASAWIEPELLTLGAARLATLQAELPALARYAHYFDRLQRSSAHAQPAAIEQLLADVADLGASPYQTYRTLVNAELPFPDVPDGHGGSVRLAQGNVRLLTASQQRPVRQAAWEGYADAHLAFRGTLAHALVGAFKRDNLLARARGYPSALDAALSERWLPRAVFDNLLTTWRARLPLWHRYWELRRRALGVETLHGYDIDVGLSRVERTIPYDTACELVCAAMEPLGDEYGSVLRRALYEERWVDWSLNQGTLAGAESSGTYRTHPFLLVSFDHSLLMTSVLAHELGHSLHSALSWQAQPPVYAYYADVVSETASNVNQALLRAHLLTSDADPDFQIEVLSEALAILQRYLFLMPVLTEFEVECHARLERGEGLTADSMSELLANLFRDAYGPAMTLDAERIGIGWAQHPHLYLNFYTHPYALGIAAALALAADVLRDGAAAAARYLAMLRAGDSDYPLDVLRLAGIDLATPDPVERAFDTLEQLLDRLETIIGAGPAAGSD